MAPKIEPTDEQQAIIDAGLRGDSVLVQALAGTGKTTVMSMVADAITKASSSRARIRVIVYNKEAAKDGAKKFPRGTECSTIHSLARGVVLNGHCDRHLGINGAMVVARIKPPDNPLKPWDVARRLDVEDRELTCSDGTRASITASAQVALAKATVDRFCNSDSPELGESHVVLPSRTPECLKEEVTDLVLCAARNLWTDLTSSKGRLVTTHDTYLKLFQLWITGLGIQMPYDTLILDEAQDTTPCVSSMLTLQQMQLMIVGDSHQSLYGWRGARDALRRFERERGFPTLSLTRSWRFGPQIAAEGNNWLELLRSPLRVVGDPSQSGSVGWFNTDERHAVLCRTNAGVISAALDCMETGRTAHIVGGNGATLALARGIADIREGKKSSHPSLALFEGWDELVSHADSELCDDDSELRLAVNLVSIYGPRKIIATLLHCDEPEGRANVVLSTMHRSKGREWPNVLIARDTVDPGFDEHGSPAPVRSEDAMLYYVACTRARRQLDNGALSFVHAHLDRVASPV